MGTDIHGVFQRHDQATEKWVDVEHKFEMNRHYQLFAVLADVRNGRGFAGVKTGEVITPIAEPRGYPDGFEVDGDHHIVGLVEHIDPRRRKYRTAEYLEPGDNPLELWMGDHSHSWLTADEMLAWFQSAPIVVKTGIFGREDYDRWDKKSLPDFGYCGGICGTNIVLINDNQQEREGTPNWTHIRCEWDAPLRDELSYFFDEVKRLKDEHGTVRFVFGFDS